MDAIQFPKEGLSNREYEVLELVARGHKNWEIASALKIEERTVRFHVENFSINSRSRTARKPVVVIFGIRYASIRAMKGASGLYRELV